LVLKRKKEERNNSDINYNNYMGSRE